MNCTNCHQPLDEGAAYCGNCGQATSLLNASKTPLTQAVTSGVNDTSNSQNTLAASSLTPVTTPNIPSYATATSSQNRITTKLTLSLTFGIFGMVGALFVPVVALSLGIAGIVLGSMARRNMRHGLALAGIILSSLAVLAGLGSWTLAIVQSSNNEHKVKSNAAATDKSTTMNLSGAITPCYSIDFNTKYNVQNVSGSCDMNAYNASTMALSTELYKIYGTSSNISSTSFLGDAKRAIEKDLHQSLPSFDISSEQSGTFAGSPAYFVTAANGTGLVLVEAAVYHSTSHGENFFVFVHAANSSKIDLNSLERGWQWAS